MSNAEARSWWADVQHLRPDAAPVAQASRPLAVDDLPSAEELDRWLAAESAVPAPEPAPAPAPAHRFERRPVRQADPVAALPEPVAVPVRRAREVAVRSASTVDRLRTTPDRIALWAVVLAVALVLVAALTSGAQA